MHTPVSAAPVIDFHVHMLNTEVFEASTNRTVFTGFGATPAKAPRPGAQSLIERMFDPAKVLAWASAPERLFWDFGATVQTANVPASGSGSASDGWSQIRQHSAYHTDTLADRVVPKP
jgi:hypothetical protein